jgi:hypothetical protein
MHSYGDKDIPEDLFDQVDDAASYIGNFIARWGRIHVSQTKEKFGTVRVYCYFGIDCLFGLLWPKKNFIPKWWPYRIDLAVWRWIRIPFNFLFIPYQQVIYRLAYKRAIQRWPHLKDEILDCADFNELLRGL